VNIMTIENPLLFEIYWEAQISNRKGCTTICAKDKPHAIDIFQKLPEHIIPTHSKIINVMSVTISKYGFISQYYVDGKANFLIPKLIDSSKW